MTGGGWGRGLLLLHHLGVCCDSGWRARDSYMSALHAAQVHTFAGHRSWYVYQGNTSIACDVADSPLTNHKLASSFPVPPKDLQGTD